MSPLIEDVARFLGWSKSEVIGIAAIAPLRYRIYSVPKARGGRRTIFHPSRETKALQYALMHTFLDRFPIHDIAVAYRTGVRAPIRRAAEQHVDKAFTVCVDFSRFFPSIVPRDLLRTVKSSNGFSVGTNEAEFLRKSLFVEFQGDYFLGIGAPSSPMVSNIVMRELDGELLRLSRQIDQDSAITRYADDIAFSSNRKGASKKFVDGIQQLLESREWPSLQLNEAKTRYASRGSSRRVLGLTITPEGRLSIGRARKRSIRAMIHRHGQVGLSEQDRSWLRGYLAYVQDVEPAFLNRLIVQFGGTAIMQLMGK